MIKNGTFTGTFTDPESGEIELLPCSLTSDELMSNATLALILSNDLVTSRIW
jgi:hypothetical protein